MESQSGLDERVVLCGQTDTGEIVPIQIDNSGQIIVEYS
jgi:hypothetical protein